jgi:hypothetical protein
MPYDRLVSRFLPMLGSTRRPGGRRGRVPKPQVRISGVFKGADVLSEPDRYGRITTPCRSSTCTRALSWAS